MRNNEEQTQDEKLLSFPLNLLSGIKFNDSLNYRMLYEFFLSAYLDLSGMEMFDDRSYREAWQENLMHLENVTLPFKGYSRLEIDQAIAIAINVLEKNRKEVLHAK